MAKRYDDTTRRHIIECISAGEELALICRRDKIRRRSVYDWLAEIPEFQRQYREAVLLRAEVFFEKIQEIADDGRNDWMQANDPDNGGYAINGEHVQRSRLRVDTLKWRLARMNGAYADKVAVDHSGGVTIVKAGAGDEKLL